jgi:hypothetical protein
MKLKACFENILLIITIFLAIQTNVVFSQETGEIPATKEELEKKYQENILQTRLYGVYIPKDVMDAFNEFISLSPEEEILKFKNAEEDLVVKKLHYSLGRWMALNWCFYEGSRLSHHLREKGIGHPDDMISFLLRVFHRQLNDKPLEEDKIISDLKAARKKLMDENSISE